eukprot:tig00000430_g661.t1
MSHSGTSRPWKIRGPRGADVGPLRSRLAGVVTGCGITNGHTYVFVCGESELCATRISKKGVFMTGLHLPHHHRLEGKPFDYYARASWVLDKDEIRAWTRDGVELSITLKTWASGDKIEVHHESVRAGAGLPNKWREACRKADKLVLSTNRFLYELRGRVTLVNKEDNQFECIFEAVAGVTVTCMAVDDRVATFATAGPAGFKLVIWHSPDEHFTMDLAAANTPISAMCLVKGGSFVLFAEAGDTRIRLVELNEESICRGYRGIEVFDVARCPAAVKSLSISPSGRMICAVDVNGDAWGFITGPESAAGPFGSGAAPLPLGPAPVASTSAAPSSALALSSAPVASSSSASGALASASLVPIAARALGPAPAPATSAAPSAAPAPAPPPPPPRPRPRPRPGPPSPPPPPLRRPHRLAGGIQHPARGRLCRCGLGLAASPRRPGRATRGSVSSAGSSAGAAVATTAELLQKLLESEKLKAEVEELKQKLLAMEEAKGIAEASAANKERELAEARAREAAAAAGEHQELGALRAKLATADGDIARAAAEQLVMAATLQAELDDVQGSLEVATARAAEFERKLDASKSSMQTLEQERESALTLAADVQAQARTLQQELEAASARHAEEKGALEKMLADCKTARRVAVGILDFAAADYERKKEEHSATKELLDSYTHKLTALKQDIVHFMQLDPDLARKSGADVIAALRAWKQSIQIFQSWGGLGGLGSTVVHSQHFGRDGIVAASAAGAASLSGPGAEASSSSRPSSSLGRLSMDGSVILGSPAKSEGFLCAGLSASISGSDVLLASPAGILSHRSPPRAGASEGRYGPECGPATPSPSSLSLSFSAPGAPPAPILSHSPHCLPPAEDAEQRRGEEGTGGAGRGGAHAVHRVFRRLRYPRGGAWAAASALVWGAPRIRIRMRRGSGSGCRSARPVPHAETAAQAPLRRSSKIPAVPSPRAGTRT